jgi:hypothetical protein
MSIITYERQKSWYFFKSDQEGEFRLFLLQVDATDRIVENLPCLAAELARCVPWKSPNVKNIKF